MTEIIRRAQPGDEAELTAMIHELAEFERASARLHRHRKPVARSAFR